MRRLTNLSRVVLLYLIGRVWQKSVRDRERVLLLRQERKQAARAAKKEAAKKRQWLKEQRGDTVGVRVRALQRELARRARQSKDSRRTSNPATPPTPIGRAVNPDPLTDHYTHLFWGRHLG